MITISSYNKRWCCYLTKFLIGIMLHTCLCHNQKTTKIFWFSNISQHKIKWTILFQAFLGITLFCDIHHNIPIILFLRHFYPVWNDSLYDFILLRQGYHQNQLVHDIRKINSQILCYHSSL